MTENQASIEAGWNFDNSYVCADCTTLPEPSTGLYRAFCGT